LIVVEGATVFHPRRITSVIPLRFSNAVYKFRVDGFQLLLALHGQAAVAA
jgi:hypothetical protein